MKTELSLLANAGAKLFPMIHGHMLGFHELTKTCPQSFHLWDYQYRLLGQCPFQWESAFVSKYLRA